MRHNDYMTKRSCGTCNMGHFDEFAFTPTGRFKKGVAGKCLYEIPVPVLPSCVPERNRLNQYVKNAIWPGDGEDCPLHAEKR
jgi:hypothetical protein